jgi:hypothetical protein
VIAIRPPRTPKRPVSREALALALPEHRYCDQQIRGHETCLAVADGILRRLAR